MVKPFNKGYSKNVTNVGRGQHPAAGYSLVELLVGVAMISGIALMISQFSTSFNNEPTSLRRACESYTSSLISIVKEETPYRQILTFNPTGTGASRAPGNFASATRAVPTLTDYGPIAGDLEPFTITPVGFTPSANMGPRLQSFQLIQGSIRSLATIYNLNSGLRCQYGTYNPITNPTSSIPLPDIFIQATGVTLRMRIEPYVISSGASLCTSAPSAVFPGPLGLTTPDTNVFIANSGRPENGPGFNINYRNAYVNRAGGAGVSGDNTGTFNLSEVTLPNETIAHRNSASAIPVGDPDLGLRMFVDMSFTANGQNFNCASSQNFEYPADRTAPARPNRVHVQVGSNNSIANGTPMIWDHCATAAGQADDAGTMTIEVGYDGLTTSGVGAAEPGVQFLCKDLSWIRSLDPSDARRCYTRSGGTGTGGPGTFLDNQPAPDESVPGVATPYMNGSNNHQFNYTAEKSHRNLAWVPCEHLRICDLAPTSSTLLNPGDIRNVKYSMTYANLPFGCQADLEAVAVDTAGNRSSANSAAFMNKVTAGTVTLNGSFDVRNDEIYHPTCGNVASTSYVNGLGIYCPRQANWVDNGVDAAPGLSGYYTCRSHASFGVRAGTGPSDECCQNGGTGAECRPWN